MVCEDPAEADVIGFIGSSRVNFSDVTGSKTYKDHKNKSVLVFFGDRAVPILPGIYVSLEDNIFTRHRKTLAAGYFLGVTGNDALDIQEDIEDAEYLFSFIGNALHHPVRKNILQLPSARAYLKDSSIHGRWMPDEHCDAVYRQVMACSKFVLCPRGKGVSSWRTYEAMRAGRVPVIISDDWTPSPGPDWESFSLRIGEGEISTIPRVLWETESRAAELGNNARKEWETWYSSDLVFATIAEQLLEIQSRIASESRLTRTLTYVQYCDPFFLRHWVLSPIKQKIIKRTRTRG